MQTTQETASTLERRIDLSIARADIDKDVDVRLKKLSRTMRMPGFRPGKVPLKVVARTHESQTRSEAINAAVEKAFGEAVRAQNLRVTGYPRIEPKESTAADVLMFSAVFEVYPEVVVGDLSGCEIERPVLEVGEAEIDSTIDVLRKQRVSAYKVERAAADGDQVTVDFVCRKDDKSFKGERKQDFQFVLGSGRMLKEFDAGVIGLKAGETKTFDLSFPEDYHAEEIAGQTVQFEVTVKKVEMLVLPKLDADFARELGVAGGDLARLREDIKENLVREVKRRIQGSIKDQAMAALLAVTPIEAPKAMVAEESVQLAENARSNLQTRGIPIKTPMEPSWFTEHAVRRVKLGFILAELVKANDLVAKPEQVRTWIQEMAESYENPSELVHWYYAQPERLEQAEAIVTEDNVVEWVCSRTRISDTPVSFDELMSNPAAA